MLSVSLPSSSLTVKIKLRQCCVCCERITQRPRPLVSHLILWTHKNTSHTTHNTHVWEMQRLCWQWLLRGIQRWYQYFKQVDLSSFQGDVCVFLKSQNQTWTRYQRWWFECVLRKCAIRTHSRLKIQTNKSSTSRCGREEGGRHDFDYLFHVACVMVSDTEWVRRHTTWLIVGDYWKYLFVARVRVCVRCPLCNGWCVIGLSLVPFNNPLRNKVNDVVDPWPSQSDRKQGLTFIGPSLAFTLHSCCSHNTSHGFHLSSSYPVCRLRFISWKP